MIPAAIQLSIYFTNILKVQDPINLCLPITNDNPFAVIVLPWVFKYGNPLHYGFIHFRALSP